ncbi:MAG: SRPBCC family protein [Acidobacteriota bacterium]
METRVAQVRKEIVVEAPPERAFRAFTSGFDKWWPREHHTGKAPLAKAVMEPRVGGRWYEIGTDASECEWGSVLVWDPPRRVVMAWQLNAEWAYDANLVTEVEVTFTPAGALQTLVTLEHRNLERFGEKVDTVKAALDSPAGWGGLLGMFAAAADANIGVEAGV